MEAEKKLNKLKEILERTGPVLVAFSAGVDSTFLLAVAAGMFKDKLLAVTGVSPTIPDSEIAQAISLAKRLKVRHKLVTDTPPKEFWENSPRRCYYCKRELFERLKQLATRNRLFCVVDGTNADDCRDYRPGAKALQELGIRSPLKEAGLTKSEIRVFSRVLRLPTWRKPAMACLASRIPYGEPITPEKLFMVGQAEEFIRELGFTQVRVRFHGQVARIEVGSQEIFRVLKTRKKISAELKSIGFNYVSIDLDGYRSGALNEIL